MRVRFHATAGHAWLAGTKNRGRALARKEEYGGLARDRPVGPRTALVVEGDLDASYVGDLPLQQESELFGLLRVAGFLRLQALAGVAGDSVLSGGQLTLEGMARIRAVIGVDPESRNARGAVLRSYGDTSWPEWECTLEWWQGTYRRSGCGWLVRRDLMRHI